jgi:hypothetical protein
LQCAFCRLVRSGEVLKARLSRAFCFSGARKIEFDCDTGRFDADGDASSSVADYFNPEMNVTTADARAKA